MEAPGQRQTATVWLEREDGARFSWAGPVMLTEAQRAAYEADPLLMVDHLSSRPSWPLYPPLKALRVVSVEVRGRAGQVTLAWAAPGAASNSPT